MYLRSITICLLLTCVTWPAAVMADVRLPRLVDSGMVLQRDAQLNLWGWADPGEQVIVEFRDAKKSTSAGQDGRWHVQLPAMPAGGPDTLTVKGNNTITLQDVLVGDVWLASGQSNMELTLKRAEPHYPELVPSINNREIRQFDVPDRYNFKKPEQDLAGGQWVPATQEHIRNFSAVGYFFAAEIHETEGVPVGIINASLGGSPVEAWMSEDSLKKFPKPYAEGKRFRDDQLIEEITQADQKRSNAWYSELHERDKGFDNGKYLWAAPELNTSDWKTMQVPGYWPESEDGPVNGVFWFRKTINVPEKLAKQDALLIMGRIVDADEVFVNGTKVGNTTYQYPPRRYPVPADVLKPGENVITVRVTSQRGRGGFVLDKDYVLQFDDRTIDLTGDWLYKRGVSMPPAPPQTFIRWKPMGLYNGMIAPLTNYPIKGVIWFQGESNTGDPSTYRERFGAMIADWRNQWNQNGFPFLYVQLANFLPPEDPRPHGGGWPRLREAQLQTLEVPNTAMAVAIDAGEWNDIHPLDKKTVGQRLAAAAKHLAYGEDNIYSGPVFKSGKVKGKKVVLEFDHVGSGLMAKGGPLREFMIAGADGEFHEAKAEIRGDKIVVWSKKVNKPKAVRYAWSSNPEDANLYNKEGFPASPFRTDDW
jgi:sialate O-acetylesterase